MLARCLGRHSEVYKFEELHFFEQYIDVDVLDAPPTLTRDKAIALAQRLLTTARNGLFAKVTPQQHRREAEEITENTQPLNALTIYNNILVSETKAHDKRIPLEQTPRYLFAAEEILAAYPNAQMINLIRDPRDVMLSQKNRWKRSLYSDGKVPLIWTLRSWANYHAYLTPRIWVGAVNMAKKMQSHPRFHSFHYEEILREPKACLQDICSRVDIKLEDTLFEVRQIGSSTGQDKPNMTGFDASRIGAWQRGGLKPAEIAICENIAREAMTQAGYRFSSTATPFIGGLLEKVTLLPKVGIATLLNLGRFKNVGKLVRRRLSVQSAK